MHVASGGPQGGGGRVRDGVSIIRDFSVTNADGDGAFGCVVPCCCGDDGSSRSVGGVVVELYVDGYYEESFFRGGLVSLVVSSFWLLLVVLRDCAAWELLGLSCSGGSTVRGLFLDSRAAGYKGYCARVEYGVPWLRPLTCLEGLLFGLLVSFLY